jgi:hypothetical protein
MHFVGNIAFILSSEINISNLKSIIYQNDKVTCPTKKKKEIHSFLKLMPLNLVRFLNREKTFKFLRV